MADSVLNRDINKLFSNISKEIYSDDMKRDGGAGWWPLRPVFLDGGIAPFLFSELIRLFKLAQVQNKENQVSPLFKDQETIHMYQFLWTSLSFADTDISFDDKLFLVEKLLTFSRHLPVGVFNSVFDRLEKLYPTYTTPSEDEILREGTLLYFEPLQPFYTLLEQDYNTAVNRAQEVVIEKAKNIKDPRPWDDKNEEDAVRKLFRNSDFRREKEKDMELLLEGQPGAVGIAEGIIGETIEVVFAIETLDETKNGYITDVDAFKKISKELFVEHGIPVVSATRNATHKLQKGQRVWINGTNGRVFSLDK